MARQSRTAQKLANLHARGFDRSERRGRYITVRCSQCQAAAINGHACHETGCPNARHECKGCNELIPMQQTYCATCNGFDVEDEDTTPKHTPCIGCDNDEAEQIGEDTNGRPYFWCANCGTEWQA